MSKTSLSTVLCAWSLCVAGSASAQTVLTLQEAVRLAAMRDPRVVELTANEQRAGREAALARSRFGPNVFTGTGAMYTYGFPQTPGGAPPAILNLAFQQTVFDGPARGRLRAADQRADVQKLATARVRDTAVTDTVVAYLELAHLRQLVGRLRAARASGDRVVELLRERLDQGRALPVEVLEARLSGARIGERIEQLEGREIVLEGQLQVLTGLPVGERLQVTLETLPLLPERSVGELTAMAIAASPDLKAAELERRAREENLNGERGGYFPSVDLVANYAMFSKFNNIDTYFTKFQRNNVNVGIEARVPIFSASASASVALARSQLLEADTAIRRQRDQIQLDVRQAAQLVRHAAAAHEVADLALALAQENVRLAEIRANEGRADRLDLERTLVEEGRAWDTFFQAELERERAQLGLRQMTGELSRLFP